MSKREGNLLRVKKIMFRQILLQKLTLLQCRVDVLLTWRNSESNTVWQAKPTFNQLQIIVKSYINVVIRCQVVGIKCNMTNILGAFHISRLISRLFRWVKLLMKNEQNIYKYCTRLLCNIPNRNMTEMERRIQNVIGSWSWFECSTIESAAFCLYLKYIWS